MDSFVIHTLFLLLALYTVLTNSSPISLSQHVLKGPQAGQIIDSSRLVLKLDCPECPNVDVSFQGAPSSIIYDLSITRSYPPTIIWTQTHPEIPGLKKEHPLFPPPRSSNATPYPLLLVPSSFSLDSYVSDPTLWTDYHMHAGNVESVVISTTSPWNITRVSFIPSTFEDLPVAVIYLLNSRLNGLGTCKQMQFVWWELVTAVEYFEDPGKATSKPRPDRPLPAGLKAKLEYLASESHEQQVVWVG